MQGDSSLARAIRALQGQFEPGPGRSSADKDFIYHKGPRNPLRARTLVMQLQAHLEQPFRDYYFIRPDAKDGIYRKGP